MTASPVPDKEQDIHLVSPRGAPRHFLCRQRARVPRLRRDRALQVAPDLRSTRDGIAAANRAGRPSTPKPFPLPGNSPRRPVARAGSEAIEHRQSNGLQNRRCPARRRARRLDVIERTKVSLTPRRESGAPEARSSRAQGAAGHRDPRLLVRAAHPEPAVEAHLRVEPAACPEELRVPITRRKNALRIGRKGEMRDRTTDAAPAGRFADSRIKPAGTGTCL